MLAITSMLLLVVKLGWAAQCNKLSGPPGGVDCIQKHSYNDEYQWMTCLTDAYIQQKGNQKDHCEDRTATYCWYPCMLEVHGKRNGSVTSDCSCTYCLDRNNDKTQFNRNFNQNSILVPLLRPGIHSTCGEIQERAFAYQTPCHLNPGNGVLSAYDVDCFNYLQILWSIKGSFVKVDTVWESLKGMWNIGEKCTWYSNIRKCYRSIELKDSPVKVIKLKIEKFFSAIKALN